MMIQEMLIFVMPNGPCLRCVLLPVLTPPFMMSFIWLSGSSVQAGALSPILQQTMAHASPLTSTECLFLHSVSPSSNTWLSIPFGVWWNVTPAINCMDPQNIVSGLDANNSEGVNNRPNDSTSLFLCSSSKKSCTPRRIERSENYS